MSWVKVHSYESSFKELDDQTVLLEFENGDTLGLRVRVGRDNAYQVHYDLFATLASFKKLSKRKINCTAAPEHSLGTFLNDLLFLNNEEFANKIAARLMELVEQKARLEKRSVPKPLTHQAVTNRGSLWGAWS